MRPLTFPAVDRPALSMIMVTYGGWKWVREALGALIEYTEPCYEVIVVDNASPDETPDRLRDEVEGAKVLFNPGNLGFAAGVNRGVCHATAPFLGLLNSDAMVQPGWLPPLLEGLETDPRAGAVVPMLLNLDGKLQEAGSLLGGDGTTLAWGSGEDATGLQYRFRRYVDYASAACLLMKRSTFLSIGGLDPHYPIGYYEDVDMCLALADQGLRVVYEPRSRVKHVRWGSSTVEEAGRLMHANRPILLRRWQHKLKGRPSLLDWQLPLFPHRVVAARDAEALHRVLVIADGVPGLDSGRAGKLLAGFMEAWPNSRTTVIAEDTPRSGERVLRLLEAGIEVALGPDDWDAWLAARLFHYSVVLISSAEAFERFDQLLNRHQPQALRVYDLGQLPPKRELESLQPPETEAIRSADVVFCSSEEQRRYVAGLAPGIPAPVLPNETNAPPGRSGPHMGDEPSTGSPGFRRAMLEAMAHVGMAP